MRGVWRNWLRVAAIWMNALVIVVQGSEVWEHVRVSDGLSNVNPFSIVQIFLVVTPMVAVAALFWQPRA